MDQPEVCQTALELYESLGALTGGDEDNDWHLLLFCDALCSVLVERIDEIAADHDDRPGWQIVFDPSDCPAFALPYLAQFVGVQFAPALTEDQQRTAIKVPEGWQRGTVAAMLSAIQRQLTGAQTVIFREREPDAYGLAVRTLTSETPDTAAVERAILTQKPIGIVLDYEAIDGMTWDDLVGEYADWNAVGAGFADWHALKTTAP